LCLAPSLISLLKDDHGLFSLAEITTGFNRTRAKGTNNTPKGPPPLRQNSNKMSKRGTENQLTKDEYDRDAGDDEGSSIQGVFKQASAEEMSKRV
jgi:hypothetical protein